MERRECSELDTLPIVALHSDKTLLTSPLLSLKVTYLPSIANICADVPALLAICAPFPGNNSIA